MNIDRKPPPPESAHAAPDESEMKTLDLKVGRLEDALRTKLRTLLEVKDQLPTEVTGGDMEAIKTYVGNLERVHTSLAPTMEIYEDLVRINDNVDVISARWAFALGQSYTEPES